MKWNRFLSAFRRYRRSKGFGIHSPFAFKFVLNVLRERNAYYAYDDIATLREQVEVGQNAGGISQKEAQMLFRIANYFNPTEVMQMGDSPGVAGASILNVSSNMQMYLYGSSPLVSAFGNEVHRYADFLLCRDEYSATDTGGTRPFVIVEEIPEGSYDAVCGYLSEILCRDAVVILRNVGKDATMHSLWMSCRDASGTGMTFSNDKLAVLVASPKLQHQHFSLWF